MHILEISKIKLILMFDLNLDSLKPYLLMWSEKFLTKNQNHLKAHKMTWYRFR